MASSLVSAGSVYPVNWCLVVGQRSPDQWQQGDCDAPHYYKMDLNDFHGFLGYQDNNGPHKTEVMAFLKGKSLECLRDFSVEDRCSAYLSWQLVALLCQTNGHVMGSDIAELLHCQETARLRREDETTVYDLVDICDIQPKPRNKDTLRLKAVLHSTETDDFSAMEHLRQLLLAGKTKEALDHSTHEGLWGHAFLLESKMGSAALDGVIARFANSMEGGDPLKTLYQAMSGRVPDVAKHCGETFIHWHAHLAMILSAKSDPSDIQIRSIRTMGDSLASKGMIEVAHFCYSAAQILLGAQYKVPFQVFLDPEQILPLVLLGTVEGPQDFKGVHLEALRESSSFSLSRSSSSGSPTFSIDSVWRRTDEIGLTTPAICLPAQLTSDSEPSGLQDSPVADIEADCLQPLAIQNLANQEDAEKAIKFGMSPGGDQSPNSLPVVTNDTSSHNLECPSSGQGVVHAKEVTTFVVTAQDSLGFDVNIPQAEHQSESMTNLHLAVEGDTVAAPIPISPQSFEERTYVESYNLNAGPRRRFMDVLNTSQPEVSAAPPNMWDLMTPMVIPDLKEDQDEIGLTTPAICLPAQELMCGTRPIDLATIEGPVVFGPEASHIKPLSDAQTVKRAPGNIKAVAPTVRAVSTKDGAPSFKRFCQSWLGWIVPQKKEVHLPDDTNKSIFWDKSKQRWVDCNEPEEETKAIPPPPPMGLPLLPLSNMGSQTGSGGPASGPLTNGPPANMFRKRAGTQIRYIDVMNPGGYKPGVSVPPPTMLALLTPVDLTGNIFHPDQASKNKGHSN